MSSAGTVSLAAGMLLAAAALFAEGNGEEADSAGSSLSGIELVGAGASFPFPIYSKMFDEYDKLTGVRVNYQSIGSSGGIKTLENQVVDFGASDAYLTDKQLAAFDAPVVHIPTVLGAVVVTYNLPGNPALRLTGAVVAGIFLGAITRWNDPAIEALNPEAALPAEAIIVVHRSDGSGTTFNFTYYLSKVSEAWRREVGNATAVDWPVGLGAAQNAGVAGIVEETSGSIGYVELSYALENGLPCATLRNRAGAWTSPSLESTAAAAGGRLPADMRIDLGDTSASDGYPIANLTWIIVYREQKYGGRSLDQARALVKLLAWVTHEGQRYAAGLQYARLPPAAVANVDAILRSITYGGVPLVGP